MNTISHFHNGMLETPRLGAIVAGKKIAAEKGVL
jgi:hypothetical protein